MGRAAIIGDGAWGTALALLLRERGHHVRVWSPFPDLVERIAGSGRNELRLPGVPLPSDIEWTADPAAATAGAELVVWAVPSRYAPDVLPQFSGLASANALWVSATKGLHPTQSWRMTEAIERLLGSGPVVALSGPSFAEEVARGAPTAVVAACRDGRHAEATRDWFASPRFRVYTSDDVVGVELGGVLKNVIAIAAGACDGLGLGANAKAALVTRGLAEISRLGVALGAHPATFAGLSGVGDLMLTCYGRLSRNREFGERLGRGESPPDILARMAGVAEGVTNCAHAATLAREMGVDMPIAEAVRDVIAGALTPMEAVERLMQRDPRPERDHWPSATT